MPSIKYHRHRAKDPDTPVGNDLGAGDGAPTAATGLAADESLVELRCSVVVARGGDVLLLHRSRDSVDEWVLPGGRPRPFEGMLACAGREVAEETGVRVVPDRCAFVADVIGPGDRGRQVELVFTATLSRAEGAELVGEDGAEPVWVPAAEVRRLNLRPAVAGFLPDLVAGRAQTAPYLGNLWREPREAPQAARGLSWLGRGAEDQG